jgi:DNA-binding beta-propeller fold protein YncE
MMKIIIYLFTILSFSVFAQDVIHVPIDTLSTPQNAEIQLRLAYRFQQYNSINLNPNDHFDRNIHSPKSVHFLRDTSKFYVNSLEGFKTVVYDAKNYSFIKTINHHFQVEDSSLFNHENTVFGYAYKYRKDQFNIFSGKPVEMCTTHDDRYLWITYYRRSYDKQAISPSALAIVDTQSDEIIRIMPTGPLPKMIASSPDDKFIAVTQWGDNTIGIIDISSGEPSQFHYLKQFIVGNKLSFNFEKGEDVDRDNDCGYCLRGTIFTPDSRYLLVGRMGGNGGIAVFDMQKLEYLGTVFGMKINIRHIVITGDEIFLSSNLTGYVQKANIQEFITNKLSKPGQDSFFNGWKSCYAGGKGVRTISTTPDGKYIFATVNNDSKIVVIRSVDMKLIATIPCDSYPVGMDLAPDDKHLVVTSQGKNLEGGNSVMVYEISYCKTE